MLRPVLYSSTMNALTDAIYLSSHKIAVHTYNVANASTPGFEAMHFHDEFEKAKKRRKGLESKGFSLETEMASLAQEGLHHSALVKLFSTKQNILQRIASMGKT